MKRVLLFLIAFCCTLYSAIGQNLVINGENYICSGSSTTLSAGVGSSSPSSGNVNCTSSVNMSNTTTTVSNGQTICFYDSGGPNGSYGNSESYVHTFTASGGGHVTITFLTANGESCCDYITIYDGAGTGGTQLHYGLLNTVNGNVSYTSSGTSLTVQFTSDGSVTYDGWHAVVSYAANTAGSVNMSNTTTVVTCGQGISFYDSGGPNGTYGNSESYVHTFTSSNGNPLTITFLSTDGESCCDYITIYNGAGTSGTQLHYGLLSTVAGVSFTSTGNSITVQFTSDGSVTYNGWYAIVSCDACSLANTTYHWSTGASTNSITVSPTTTTTYSVTTTSPDCGTQVASITVNVQDCGADGCPSIAPAQQGTGLTEIVVDCNTNSITLEANAVATALQTNSYTVTAIPYNPPYGFTAGTRIFTDATDDTWGEVLTLPFGFCYYGNTYNQIVPGANSVATFNTSVAGGSCAWSYSESLPNSNLFTNTIFACYRDIYPNYYTGDGIYQGVLGSYPCRSYVLSFNNIALFSCYDVRTFSSQIVLYEGTNIIDIYLRDAPTCLDWNSGNGVIGIQNSTGSAATVPPGRNTGAWTAHNEAWRFIPNGGEPVYTVTWYEGQGTNGPVVGTGDVITITPVGTTYYTARLQYHACNGDEFDILNYCHVTMNNNADPITVTASPDFLCPNAPTTISVNAPNATGYHWNTGATTSSFVARPNQSPTTYSVTVSYGNGCSSVGSVTVTLDLEPPAYSGNVGPQDANNNNCVFTVPDLTSLFRPYVTDNYTSNPNITITQSPAAGTVITTATTVTITFTDECGNSSTTTVVVNADNPMNIGIANTQHILCYGDTTGLAAVTVSGGQTPYTYSWSSNNGFPTSSFNGASASPLMAGTYTVTATDANGCHITQTITLNNLTDPMIAGTVSSAQDICRGTAPSPFTVTGCTGGDQGHYQWQQSTDNQNFTDISGATSTTYTAGTLSNNTCYRVAYISDACGTVYTNSVCVTLHDPTSSDVYDEVCQGHAYNVNGFSFSATETQTPGVLEQTAQLQNAWGCDSIVTLHLTVLPNSTGTDVQTIVENNLPYTWNGVTFTEAGTQTATLTASNGCDSVVTMTLTVIPNIHAAEDTTICENELPLTWQGHTFNTAGSFDLVFQAAGGSDSIVTLTVYTIPAQFVTVNGETCQHEPYSGYGFTVSADSTAEVGVVQRVQLLQTAQGCDSTVTLLLTVHPVYDQTFDVVACDSMVWNGIVYPESGTYTQQFSSAHGCDSVVTKNLEVVNTDLVLTNLTEDFCEDLTAVLEVTTELQYIHWNTGETTPQIVVHRAGTYVVTAHTAQCEAFARVDIHPCPFYMFLPNAITPSISTGENDEFHIPDGIAEQLETCEIWIYDRWGMMVYHSTDPHFRWDGTVNGEIATNNVFSYRLKVSVFGGGNYQYTGTITVL